MVYYVDKIQDLETEIARLRSLRSSDKLKNVKELADNEAGDEESEATEVSADDSSSEALAVKGKKMGERVYAAVCNEKEDLDEIILTRTKLDKGIQVVMDEKPEPLPKPKTVSKGIQVSDSTAIDNEDNNQEQQSTIPSPPPPPPTASAPPSALSNAFTMVDQKWSWDSMRNVRTGPGGRLNDTTWPLHSGTWLCTR